MGQNGNPDGLKILRELIEREKAEAYHKIHGDDFPEKWTRRQAGKPAQRVSLMPLPKILAGVLPVLLVVMIGLWLYFGKKEGLDHPLIGTKTVESLLREVPLQTRILERRDVLRRREKGLKLFEESLETILYDGYRRKSSPDDTALSIWKALQACLGGRKWGGQPRSQGLASPASAAEMIEKENVRTRLFAEIISKLKEV
jgi:hypothetical protein